MSAVKNLAIILLSITTIVFSALFLSYYNNVDNYMKEKERNLERKEIELKAREKHLKECERCFEKEAEYVRIIKSIFDLAEGALKPTKTAV